jgi:hypothetical protein
VLAVRRRLDGTAYSPHAIVYGTAFPIGRGLFVTAAHVLAGASGDGQPALGVIVAGQPVRPYRVSLGEQFDAVDLAVMRCEPLDHLPPLPLDFDQPLGLLSEASAVGFPLALDAEHVTISPRGFAGHVVARRPMYQMPQQPVGYELSFFAPRGLSGAPLISTFHGAPRCYGYIVQQSSLGLGPDVTPVGIAVSIEVLLGIVFDGTPLARVFGRELVQLEPPTPAPLAGGVPQIDLATLEEGWPDDEDAPTS